MDAMRPDQDFPTEPAFEDVLANVLSTHRISSGIWDCVAPPAPWAVRVDHSPANIFLHVVVRGACCIKVDNHDDAHLLAGDVVFLPRGTGHIIASSLDADPIPLDTLMANSTAAANTSTNRGAKGRPRDISGSAELICGTYLLNDSEPHPVLGLLPERLIISARETDADHAIIDLISLLHREINQAKPGVRTVVPNLLEVLFVLCVRRWAQVQPIGRAGWLGALQDRRLAGVLAALHAKPGHGWTLNTLARHAGMSPATLKRQFSQSVGEPPLTYLRRIRLERAGQALRSSVRSIAEIASESGYTSEFAFSRAFKAHYQMSPGRYRDQRRNAAGG